MSGPRPPAALRLWGQSLRTQLVLWNVVALALLLGALGVTVRYTVHSVILASIDAELGRRTGPPADHPPFGGPPGHDVPGDPFPGHGPPDGFGPPDGAPHGFGGPHDHGAPDPGNDVGRPRRFDLSGRSWNPPGLSPRDPQAFARALGGETVFSTVASPQGPLRVVTRPFPAAGRPWGVIEAAYPLSDVDRALRGVNRALLALIPVGLLVAGLGGALLTGRVLGRVQRMTQAAARISTRDLSERLPVAGQDEFAALAGTFNALLERIETAFRQQARLIEQQRRFTADASHELKTPLTIIKGSTSLALAGEEAEGPAGPTLREIDRAADVMERLVQDLLLLARSDGGQLGRHPVEVLIREILERATPVAARRGVPVRLEVADETLRVLGNEGELVRLFSNLIDNAARHSPPDSPVVVRAAGAGGDVAVTVTDRGAGIAPGDLPHLGERFFRVDAARARPDGGTGLGLSICRGIVEAHAGTLSFESVLGRGTTARVALPAAGHE